MPVEPTLQSRDFFRALKTGIGRSIAEDIYRRHIYARTSGVEPPSEYDVATKAGLENYVLAAEALSASMSENGYQPDHPVPIGSNGLPRNGAHRLASASVHGLEVHWRQESEEGWPWEWASIAALTNKNERLLLLRAAFDLAPTRSVPFILWGPVMDEWDNIVRTINEALPVQGYVDLAFPGSQRPAFHSLVYDVYSHGIKNLRTDLGFIDRKNAFLDEFPSFVRVGCALAPAPLAGAYRELAGDLKRRLRSAHNDKVPEGKFITCHFADNPEEALHLAGTLLNPDNIAVLRWRPSSRPRDQFLERLSAYRCDVEKAGLAIDDCCVVGSSVLETIGVRQATDVDFTVRNGIRATKFGPGAFHLPGGTDLVTENYHRSARHRCYSDTQIVETPGLHLMFRGLKIAAPWIVRDRKEFSGRPKDLLDVEALDLDCRDWIDHLSLPWR